MLKNARYMHGRRVEDTAEQKRSPLPQLAGPLEGSQKMLYFSEKEASRCEIFLLHGIAKPSTKAWGYALFPAVLSLDGVALHCVLVQRNA